MNDDDDGVPVRTESFNELKKKLARERKQASEALMKEKLDKKKLDYDMIQLILEVFGKSKFNWRTEHFEVFDESPDSFRGKLLPNNNRECVMLGVRLGTMRGKIIYNLRDRQLTEKQRQDIDDLIWNFVWFSWQEARILNDHAVKENL
jgi:hypothetical protein